MMYVTPQKVIRSVLLRRHALFLVLAVPLALSMCSQRAADPCEEPGDRPCAEERPARPAP